ncbi:RagB/SusD family nutrient uptake outer membrane protein [Marinifilum sp. RC60d5]|uniref:RagB/SusD family nutrient uptake outer membrane protein n=1 Tax=Marinifilum sp. RC60d5 TaxID=3458414 RepID=UPI00403746F5
MKINILTYIATALIVLSFSSCEDFLTEVNPNEMSTDSYWKNLKDCESGLVAVYNQFRDPGVVGLSDENNRSDLTYPGWGRPTPPNPNDFYNQTFTSSTSGVNKKWESLYKGIFRANQVITGLNGIEADMDTEDKKEQWSSLMGEARFFRGLFYFYLYNSYNNGSVILYDFVPESQEDFNQPLAPATEILTFFRADLEYALSNLPESWTEFESGIPSASNDVGRVTSGAAAAILGKSYLFEKDYAKAAEYFKGIIDSGVYRLMDNVGDNFTMSAEFNQESILEVSYNEGLKLEESQWSAQGTCNTYNMAYSPVGGWRTNYPSNWLIIEYRKDPMDETDPRNMITEEDGTQRLRTFSLRTSYSVALVDDIDMTYYDAYITGDATVFKNGETAYWRKMTHWEDKSGNTEKDYLERSGINFRLIRLADVYLMYAEALIKGGTDDAGVTEALKYVNKVRYRSALQLLGASAASEYSTSQHDEEVYTAASLMDHLMYKERPLELSGEGNAIRVIDMRRWGIAKERFNDLANRKYWAENYVYYSERLGKSDTKWQSILREGAKPVPSPNDQDFSEFAGASLNFDESRHSYFPIPTSETTANSMVN